MKSKKALGGLLGMGVILALAALGLVYTNWAQDLNINGEVQTGKIVVSIENDLPPQSNDDKGFTTCSTGPLNVKSKKITVEIANGYPGFECQIFTVIDNQGKLPVAVKFGALTFGGDVSPKGDQVTATTCGGAAQLDGGQNLFCDITFTVTKAALQNQTITFDLPICAVLADLKPGFNQNAKC